MKGHLPTKPATASINTLNQMRLVSDLPFLETGALEVGFALEEEEDGVVEVGSGAAFLSARDPLLEGLDDPAMG